MLKICHLLVIVLVAGCLNFCATTYKFGKLYSTKNVDKIIIGKTSENDVRNLFGDPWKTGIQNGHSVYTYCYEEIVFNHDDSIDKNGNTLVIEFDENKRVMNYYFNIPGKEVTITSLLMHHNTLSKQQQEQVAWQSQISTIPVE